MKRNHLLFLFLIFSSFTINPSSVGHENVIFQGQLLRNEAEKVKEPWWQMKALLMANNKVIASAHIDEINGNFEMNFTRSLYPKVDLAITQLHEKDTLYFKTFEVLEKDTIRYVFYPYR